MSTTIPIARRSATRQNLRRSALGSLAAAGAVTLALAGTASAADSSNTVALKKAGDTRLTLDKKAGAALKSLGIKVGPVKPSKVRRGAVVFPITSGSVDPKLTDGALINHSGGLRLTKGRTTVALRNFRVRVTDSQATISAAVGNSRDDHQPRPREGQGLPPGAEPARQEGRREAERDRCVRTEQGVQDKRLQEGSEAGYGGRQRPLRRVHRRERRHEAHARPGTLGAITGAGYTPAIVAPATLAGTVATFPIVKSKIAADLTRRDRPSGGLSLTKSGTTTSATDFDIKLSASPTLAAAINGALPKTDILNLDTSQPKADPGRPDGDAARRRREGQHDAG